ncbi:MAG: TonB-dependent receptor [Tannerella sp.]|jgi:outer membrane receptor for ferrienterochelin and colicin|nr:TonB-dependent receptor [Tannerella sp.]
MKYIFLIITLLLSAYSTAEDIVKGHVCDEDHNPLIGANVHWHETHRGVVTNEEGNFEIERRAGEKSLMISYIGHITQTITIMETPKEMLHIILKGDVELDEVVVTEHQTGMISSRTDIFQTQRLSMAELGRAACCNLAESFETNPSVDVSFSDAATGARQIKLLGLSGTYVQMLTENYPNFRGVAQLYGLDYVPGPWMESIQISKGTSSVKNGYEAIAGQINVEYKKPHTQDKFFANLFVSDAGRYEANADASILMNDNLSTSLFVHYSQEKVQQDDNGDGFLDIPLREHVNVMNRWQHRSNQYVAQYGIRYLNESRTGGQATEYINVSDPYRINNATNRVEGYTKQAYILNPARVESIALIASGSYHEQNSMYDYTPYNVYQKNLYASLMYEAQYSPLHNISAGLSFNGDRFDENTENTVLDRRELVSGAYLQYTLNLQDRFILLAGVRADHSSMYKSFVTPRIHLKYNPFTWLNVRASAGLGYRTPNILTENNFLLSSSRKLVIDSDLEQEKAFNTGLNVAFYIPLGGKDLIINTEWYYTSFLKQVVTDMDSNPHEVHFYNLNGGKAYSNSFQIEATYQFPFLRGFTLTGAYRYTDAKTDYRNASGTTTRFRKPLISNYKGMLTASYLSPLKKWQFDLTGQFNGGGRMPLPDAVNPLWDTSYKSFQVWNSQITKYFRTWSVYLGSENMFDFMQMHPIIDASNPRGNNFDSTMIWGPIHGRKIYVGLRYNIPRI